MDDDPWLLCSNKLRKIEQGLKMELVKMELEKNEFLARYIDRYYNDQGASSAPEQGASSAPEQGASFAPGQGASFAPEQGASSATEQGASSATEQGASSANGHDEEPNAFKLRDVTVGLSNDEFLFQALELMKQRNLTRQLYLAMAPP